LLAPRAKIKEVPQKELKQSVDLEDGRNLPEAKLLLGTGTHGKDKRIRGGKFPSKMPPREG